MYILIPVIGILVGLGMLAWAAYSLAGGRKARSWPSVKGTILRSGVRERPQGGVSPDYTSFVAYEYSVGGRTYESDRLAFGPSRRVHASWNAAEEEIKRYRAGAKVWVFYDPADPASSVLQPGTQNVVVIVLTGIIFLAGSIALLGAG